ncbi:MAG TPA: phytoene/squalene synthase family protein [Gemmatimonadaceae bacterium]|nr:phytoene/squalene synthase family protein [Gemmatimonadaceae bacterium]
MHTSVADARLCAELTRTHARTFAFASNSLPPRKQRAAFALYAFCRRADDIVDRADYRGQTPQLEHAAYRRQLASALAGEPDDGAFRELAWAVAEFNLPTSLLAELLDGIGRDLTPAIYETWDHVAAYAAGVASSVGEMLVHVFGAVAHNGAFQTAVHHARTLGLAMQLTNIMRDVGEDARRGRCYLPNEDLARFGLRREDVLAGNVAAADPGWRRFAKFQITRARALYREGARGIPLLSSDSRRCTAMCAAGYAAILDAIERNAFDTFSMRARVSRWDRARIAFGTWWPLHSSADIVPSSYSATRT